MRYVPTIRTQVSRCYNRWTSNCLEGRLLQHGRSRIRTCDLLLVRRDAQAGNFAPSPHPRQRIPHMYASPLGSTGNQPGELRRRHGKLRRSAGEKRTQKRTQRPTGEITTRCTRGHDCSVWRFWWREYDSPSLLRLSSRAALDGRSLASIAGGRTSDVRITPPRCRSVGYVRGVVVVYMEMHDSRGFRASKPLYGRAA